MPLSVNPMLKALGLVLLLGLPASAQAPPCADGACEDPPRFRGAAGELTVRLPRLEEAELRVDGVLDEPAWAEAAVLSDFTQFEPVEGAPASERTEVLLFYTPGALHVGVRAYARDPSRLRATLADRDNIERDDHVRLLLDTFNDRRRAYALYLNPLGVQQDGTYNEAGGFEPEDFKPDFLFHSRGRVTDQGYEVEVRIPLKSLKFPATGEQIWGLNVVREIAATGAVESWAPLSRTNPSRLAQSGRLTGIHGLRPGTLVEVNPVLTGKREGFLDGGEFVRERFDPDFGVNLKYGVTSNLTLDATYNPDFSQVESDAGQITTNRRFAINYPEKRPFFLEGAEIFQTPGAQLVYTRSIVDPVAGAKLTGKVGSVTLGYLGAVDEYPLLDPGLAPDPGRAVYNIVRAQRDVGEGSLVGALLADREGAGEFNRVAGVDGQIRFADLYLWEYQLAGSWTRSWTAHPAGEDTTWIDGAPVPVTPRDRTGHLFQSALDRTGRHFGFRLQLTDVPDAFRARSGFLERTGVTDLFLYTRYTGYGAPGALLESWRPSWRVSSVFDGRDFWHGRGPLEWDAALGLELELRGNHRVELGYGRQRFELSPERYAVYRVVDGEGEVLTGDVLVGQETELGGLDGASVELSSAYFKTVSVSGGLEWQETPIFAEGTLGREWSAGLELRLRPTDALRVDAELRHARIHRARDGSLYSEALLPRLRAEYQLTRALFVRAVGQYSVEEVDLLRAPDGTPYLYGDSPIRVRHGNRRAWDLPQTNPLRYDLLLSYEPSPGTVVFLGYGRQMEDGEAYRFSPLEPTGDGLFVKVSYLFRS